jgi:DNA-binding response OmpR family regulator
MRALKPSVLPSSASAGAKCILLADDDPGVRESLAAVLKSDGHAVLPARDGAEAIQLAAGNPVDLVLLDLNMPVKNGWDAFERLTAMNPLVPIIILTARPNQLFTALGAGVGALVEKPPDIPRLLQTVHALLAESAEVRLARMAGRSSVFHYLSAGGDPAP